MGYAGHVPLRDGFAGHVDAITAVNVVSLEIADGELFFLVGPSGCGKTTLLRRIACFSIPNKEDA